MYSKLRTPIRGTVESVTAKLDKIAAENDRYSVVFVSDSQDVSAILESCGLHETRLRKDHDSLFVLVGDGEYLAIYGMWGIVPYLDRTIERIWRI